MHDKILIPTLQRKMLSANQIAGFCNQQYYLIRFI